MSEKLIEMLQEYKDCFVLGYKEMFWLDQSLVEHQWPIIEGKKSFKQAPRRWHQR